MHTPEQESPLHEPERIRLRAMIQFLIWFVVLTMVVHILVFGLYRLYQEQAKKQNVEITGLKQVRVAPPEPRLQPSLEHDSLPRVDMQQMRTRDLEEFKRRGWVDEKTGQVRVPDTIAQQIAQMTQPPATRSSR